MVTERLVKGIVGTRLILAVCFFGYVVLQHLCDLHNDTAIVVVVMCLAALSGAGTVLSYQLATSMAFAEARQASAAASLMNLTFQRASFAATIASIVLSQGAEHSGLLEELDAFGASQGWRPKHSGLV